MMHDASTRPGRRGTDGRLHLFPPAFQAGSARLLARDLPIGDAANDRGPDPPRPKPVRAPRPRAHEWEDAWGETPPVRWLEPAA